MSENFANSGWKEKKLWTPEPEEDERAARAKPKAPSTQGIAGTLEAANARGKEAQGNKEETAPAVPPKPAKPPKPPRSPKGPLDVLDPESSSSDESDSPALPPEYAVLDMNVPRTAMVINISHVLKRLHGCCSLNQLTKSLKTFKDSTGVTLEHFLRANPMTFKLEGRIIYLLDRNGDKWKPAEEDQPAEGADTKGRRKGGGKGEAKGGKDGKDSGGSNGHRQQHYQQWSSSGGRGNHDSWWDSGWQSSDWGGSGWSGGGWHQQGWQSNGNRGGWSSRLGA